MSEKSARQYVILDYSETFTNRHGVHVDRLYGCCVDSYLSRTGSAYCGRCGEQIRRISKPRTPRKPFKFPRLTMIEWMTVAVGTILIASILFGCAPLLVNETYYRERCARSCRRAVDLLYFETWIQDKPTTRPANASKD